MFPSDGWQLNAKSGSKLPQSKDSRFRGNDKEGAAITDEPGNYVIPSPYLGGLGKGCDELLRNIFFIILLIIGLAASCYIGGQRARVESQNKAVEIVLDYNEIRQMAIAAGKSPVDVMKSFKQAGAQSVAIPEETVDDLINNGLVQPQGYYRYRVASQIKERLANNLKTKLPAYAGNIVFTQTEYGYVLNTQGIPADYFKQLSIGLPYNAIAQAQKAELGIIARLANYPGANPKAIDDILADVANKGIKKVIFQGDQVLGFKGSVEDTAKAFARHNLIFGQIEFSKQKGESSLTNEIPANIVVVHSITQNEMPALAARTIAERFQRAVKERGVRIAYVRMYNTASDNLVKANTDYVTMISKEITKAGYSLKASHPLTDVSVPIVSRVLVGVGVAAGAMLLLTTIIDLSVISTILWSILALIICTGLAAIGDTGHKADALLSAMVFPTLAAFWALQRTPESPTASPRPLIRALGRFLCAVAITISGGILITGLLSERIFMLRIDQFMGIKLAHVAPLIILAVLLAGGIAWESDLWQIQKRRLIERLKEIGANPLIIWQAAGIAMALIFIALMVARSGNEPGVGVSPLELKFRAILDKVLFVRPRTKELIGYPLLISGIAFALRGRRSWAAPLIVVGSIGLVSALNTFCHIHTPLYISVWRVINGAAVGGILGMIFYRLIRDLPGKENKNIL